MRRWLKIAVPLGIAAAMLSVLAIGFGSTSIDAAPGGNGNGKAYGVTNGGGNGGAKASMWVEGNPIAAWGVEEYTVNGSGFQPDKPVFLSLATPGCCAGNWIIADSEGDFSFSRATGAPGTYEVTAFQERNNGKLQFMSSVSFAVTEQ